MKPGSWLPPTRIVPNSKWKPDTTYQPIQSLIQLVIESGCTRQNAAEVCPPNCCITNTDSNASWRSCHLFTSNCVRQPTCQCSCLREPAKAIFRPKRPTKRSPDRAPLSTGWTPPSGRWHTIWKFPSRPHPPGSSTSTPNHDVDPPELPSKAQNVQTEIDDAEQIVHAPSCIP